MNRLQLSAAIIECEVLRYTPAGVAIINCVLQHASSQIEATQQRQIELEMASKAAGDVALRLNEAQFGVVYRFSGFLARRMRNSRATVFHIIEFELTEKG